MKKPIAISLAIAIVSAGGMLLLSLLAWIGIYTNAASMMEKWHSFYSLTVVGTITGMIEAAIISFVLVYASVLLYEKFGNQY